MFISSYISHWLTHLFQLYWFSWWTENRSNSWPKGIPGTAQQNSQVSKLGLDVTSKLSTNYLLLLYALQKKMKFSSKNFFSKCDQFHRFLCIWSNLLKKSLMENFIFVQWLFRHYFVIIYTSLFRLTPTVLRQWNTGFFFSAVEINLNPLVPGVHIKVTHT